MQVLAFYHITLPGKLKDTSKQLLLSQQVDALARTVLPGDGKGGQPSSAISTDASAPRQTLPHPVASSGSYSGLVFTIAASEWPASAVVLDWPPTVNTAHPFKVWNASTSQGTLVLTPLPPPPTSGRKPKASPAAAAPGQAAAAEGAEPEPTQPAQSKTGIPLEGCRVELVRDGLNGRSDMVRRAPLLISHPHWNLLDG